MGGHPQVTWAALGPTPRGLTPSPVSAATWVGSSQASWVPGPTPIGSGIRASLTTVKNHAVFAKDNVLNHVQVGFHCPQFSGLHKPHRPDPGTQRGVRAPVSDTRLKSSWLRVTTQASVPTATPPTHCCSKVAGGTEASGTRSRGRGGWGPAWQSFCKPRRSTHSVSPVWPFSSQPHIFITLTSLPYHRFLNILCSVDIYSSFT